MQAGNAVNFFGYGLILPFEIIFLHQIRGFSTATAGLVLGAILGTATVVTLPTGALLDHFRLCPRRPAVVAGAATVFAIGECVHGVVLGPLIADLAPPHLLGRYISLYRLMVTGGFALGPAIGGAVLAASPDAVWWGGALAAAVIGAGFLLAGDRIPDRPLAATASNAAGDPALEAA